MLAKSVRVRTLTMARLGVLALSILFCVPLVLCGPLGLQFRKHKAIFGEGPRVKDSVDPGQPLFLTPYIEKGEIDQGELSMCGLTIMG